MNDVLLVCDLDGTLLDANGRIDNESLEKIKTFCHDGGHFTICTGRMDTDIKYVEDKLGFVGEYRISQNGAVVRDRHSHLVSLETIPKSYIPTLNDAIFSENLRTEVSDINNRYFPSPRNPEDVAEFIDSSKVIENLPAYINEGKIKPTIYLTFGDLIGFRSIREKINEKLGMDKVNVVQTSPSSLEVFSKKVSKGNAVALVQQKLKIHSEDLFVAGDAESDTSMFSLTKHTFAVQDAVEDVRKKANYYRKTVGDIVDEIYKQKKGGNR